jgi:hypothetical protein
MSKKLEQQVLDIVSDAIMNMANLFSEAIDEQVAKDEEEPQVFTIQVAVPGYNVIDTTHRAGIAKIHLVKIAEESE